MQNSYSALLQISDEINQLNDSVQLLDRIMDIALNTLSAERGFMVLKSAESKDGLEAVSLRHISPEVLDSVREYSSSVVNKVLSSGEAILTFDAINDDRFSASESIVMQKIRSIICTPMALGEEIIGAIYMDSLTDAERFNEESLRFLEAFAHQSAIALENTRRFEQLEAENRRLKHQIKLNNIFPEIIGNSEPIRQIKEMIANVADSRASVLLEGESGTGKELVAKALHMHSSRRDEAFVPVFCGGLTESILESELFGHKKGAFTGATEDKAGLFEEANGGTVFLDEIGEINLNMQTKLLRVVQEGEVKRVGDVKFRKVDVRIISATNKDLWREAQQKNFREDLYYRLNVINLKIPPLRERGDDILILARHFLEKFALENGKPIRSISKAAERVLLNYKWPGNIRELENSIERAVIMAQGTEIIPTLLDLNKALIDQFAGKTLKEIERAIVVQTLEMTEWNRRKTAELLGVSKRWLQYKIKEWGLNDI